jgi:hypothetical protein
MPQLDVSFLTTDPMLADRFNVIRRLDVVGANGRTTPTVDEVFTDVVGVVTQQDPADLLRREDGQAVPRSIFVASMFEIRGSSVSDGVQYQPDLIEWDGSKYVVRQVFPYSRFGGGTFEVVAEIMVAVNAADTGRGGVC